MNEIVKLEPRLAKNSGYFVKIVEKSGKPLSKCFSKDFSDARCNSLDCSKVVPSVLEVLEVNSNEELKRQSLA